MWGVCACVGETLWPLLVPHLVPLIPQMLQELTANGSHLHPSADAGP